MPGAIPGWSAPGIPGPDPRGWTDFAQKFAKSYGQAPPRIASLAYDAVSMAIVLAGGAEGQRYTQAAITRPSGFTGIDGAYRLLADGTADRSLAILEVQRFGAAIVEAAPSAPSSPPAARFGRWFQNLQFHELPATCWNLRAAKTPRARRRPR